jgi:hypothetical protein
MQSVKVPPVSIHNCQGADRLDLEEVGKDSYNQG